MTEFIGIKRPKESPGHLLGWLIQNSAVGDADLCATLLEEYARPLELLALALKRGPLEQVRLVEDTLVYVLTNRRAYRGEVSGLAWLYSAALHLALAPDHWLLAGKPGPARRVSNIFVQPLDASSHWAGLLNGLGSEDGLLALGVYGLGLAAEELAIVLGLAEAHVQARLLDIQRRLAVHAETCSECVLQSLRLADVEASLRADYTAQPGPLRRSPSLLANWKDALLRRASGATSGWKMRSNLLQTAQASLFVVLVLAGIWLAGSVWMPQAGRKPTPTPAQVAQLGPTALATATLAAPTPTTMATPDPASQPAGDLAAVLRLAKDSPHLWKSLWADARIAQYSVPAFSGLPGMAQRKQIWIQQPGLSRFVQGGLEGSPARTYVIAQGHVDGLNLENGQTFADESGELILDPDLRKLIWPDELFLQGGDYRLVGSGTAAGRTAWIVDWKTGGRRAQRVWIDALYGVVLRRQEFSLDGADNIRLDHAITSIYFDADFPSAIFQANVYNGAHFANDPFGVPEIPDYAKVLAHWSSLHAPGEQPPAVKGPGLQPSALTPPGPDFYPGSLSFQNMVNSGSGLQTAVQLLAGGYPLGLLPLSGKNILSCQRSADSSKIAYTSSLADAVGSSVLYLADLMSVQAGRPVLPDGITAGDYAFSPDSRKLAFFGCDRASGACGVYVLDILSRQLKKVLNAAYADYILWKPDGKGLALVGSQTRPDLFEQTRTKNLMLTELMAMAQIWHFFVLDPSNGDVVYKRGFDWKTLSAPTDSPTMGWATSFKRRAAGLEGCTAP
jgi:hypothetical protein